MPATLVRARTVWTLDPRMPRVEAVGVRSGRIVELGTAAEVRSRLPGAREIDLGEATVVPGLVDAHGHLLLLGQRMREVDLFGAESVEQIAARVAARAATTPRGGWICGRGWDQNRFARTEFPDRNQLDRLATSHPVFLERIDGHAALVNARALTIAGLDRGSGDPPGGRILRRPDGEPTGVLVDSAMELVRRCIPAPTRADLEQMLRSAARRCAEVGLVGVHEAGADVAVLEALARLAAADLPLRVYAMARFGDPGLPRILERGPVSGDRLAVRAVKLFVDGALGSRGAALFEDYADEPGNRGLWCGPDDLAGELAAVMGKGFQVACHAIGDRANALTLDAIAQAQERTGRRDLRPRIEHAQVLRPEDVARFAELGVVASVQPAQAQSDAPWLESRLGPARTSGAFAFQALKRAGARLAFGSDFPIEDPNPLPGLHAACFRGSLSPREALDGFTCGAAWASFQEDEAGTLALGKRADLSAFDVDPLSQPEALAGGKAVLTMVGGRVCP